jgi:hypothetical protein
MANLTLSVPILSPIVLTSPTSWYDNRTFLKDEMTKVWKKYGNWFKYYAELTKVPAEILFAFCMVESGGDPLAGGSNSLTQGLMQFNRKYVAGSGNSDYTLSKEFLKGRLSQAEKDKLKQFGITFDANGNTRALTQKDLQNPELNIFLGAITLGQYIDEPWGKDANGNVRMDRIISLYNWGLGGFTKTKIARKDLKGVLASVPITTKAYINKMLGKNGALDIAVNDNVIS